MSNELIAEYGTTGNIGFAKATLCDANGNPVEQPNCSCGKPSSTFLQGKEAVAWMCNDCLYPDQNYSANFVYKPPGEK